MEIGRPILGDIAEGSGGGGFGGHYHGLGGGLGDRGLGSGGAEFFHHGSAEAQRYQIEAGVMAHNVFNKVNLGTPIGNVQSSLFGQSISLAGGFFGISRLTVVSTSS